jgi:hypothetical protein
VAGVDRSLPLDQDGVAEHGLGAVEQADEADETPLATRARRAPSRTGGFAAYPRR